MGRIKKPDPSTQKLIVSGMNSEALFLLNDHLDMALSHDDSGEYRVGDFNRLAKGERDNLIAKYLGELIKRDYIETYGRKYGYDLATEQYSKEQQRSKEHWSIDNE